MRAALKSVQRWRVGIPVALLARWLSSVQLQTVRVTEMLDELDRFEKKLKGRPVPAPPSSARVLPPPKPSTSAVAAAQPLTSAEGDVPTDAAGATDASPAGETVADHD
eukprot:COSAG01_NODE_6671_length_3553_cov_23.353214_6_plen_108_part_00